MQHHAEKRKKEITDAATGGAEPTGRRKANERTWVQHHAEKRKKEITDAATGGAEPTGRRKANERTWVQHYAGSVTLGRWMRGRKNRGEREQKNMQGKY